MSTRKERVEARQRAWQSEVTRNLPKLLDKLVESPGCASGPPPKHGVYLFSERGKRMYVGRTGRTEKAKLADKVSSSNLATRRSAMRMARRDRGRTSWRSRSSTRRRNH